MSRKPIEVSGASNALKNFNNGASEVFSVVVSNFNPNTTIQVEADAGNRSDTFRFGLGQTNCAFATLSPQPTEDLVDWRDRLWSSLVVWTIAHWITL
ncbi:MAG TPA: hypothetical protein VIX17_02955 [Pyrinomonadaceae bacterium]